MTLESFDPALLRNRSDTHPLALVQRWLEQIHAYGERWRRDDPASPPQALYLYSSQSGCGKTHLSVAAGYVARDQHERRVGVIIEELFLQQMWACGLDEKPLLLDRLIGQPWLLLVDALGQRESTRQSVRNEYYGLIDRRYTSGGWTIFASNFTPDELLEYGVLNPYAHSRLMGMIATRTIMFQGDDQRLRVSEQHAPHVLAQRED